MNLILDLAGPRALSDTRPSWLKRMGSPSFRTHSSEPTLASWSPCRYRFTFGTIRSRTPRRYSVSTIGEGRGGRFRSFFEMSTISRQGRS